MNMYISIYVYICLCIYIYVCVGNIGDTGLSEFDSISVSQNMFNPSQRKFRRETPSYGLSHSQ